MRGSKFKQSKGTDFEKPKEGNAEGMDDCINTCCTKKEISKHIDNKIVKLKNRSACHKASASLLRNHQIKKTLADVHIKATLYYKYIKLVGMWLLICKRFYALILMKELEVIMGNNKSNKTYEIINATNENDIVDKHGRF